MQAVEATRGDVWRCRFNRLSLCSGASQTDSARQDRRRGTWRSVRRSAAPTITAFLSAINQPPRSKALDAPGLWGQHPGLSTGAHRCARWSDYL